jgi:hypothetical protein
MWRRTRFGQIQARCLPNSIAETHQIRICWQTCLSSEICDPLVCEDLRHILVANQITSFGFHHMKLAKTVCRLR